MIMDDALCFDDKSALAGETIGTGRSQLRMSPKPFQHLLRHAPVRQAWQFIWEQTHGWLSPL